MSNTQTTVDTLYTAMPAALFNALQHIQLLVCDVDGVFSDGRIYLGNAGEELKAFHTRDGYGVKALVDSGVAVAVITGRRSAIVENRMKALNVAHIVQGEENKSEALAALMNRLSLKPEHVAVVGDDMPDTGMYPHASVKIAVKDAHPAVAKQANWITTLPGGFGAVREICDTLLQANDKLHGIQGASV
ncbi:3-deoxy-manno-octulosonate-8-phosphatase KdsC [Alteromonas sp. 1_MG-2023]|uniref:3-deoxy-manno-octulosonate-8-phosphatase KdsC n=1 Tax=Alteromonas sp. 1_MG-2023 TaxID=3062669 RepID=UPI0026E2D931|nr:3-deoxy-manno-octulosonate-8-phosphatase KdsC [Alteromonas sp. 1_MG-2023]MDO6565624.1 3-deoxy-manno-octulosonate-8-phosphatase KdsC [Alteromonas sp. 1_MG-2023]